MEWPNQTKGKYMQSVSIFRPRILLALDLLYPYLFDFVERNISFSKPIMINTILFLVIPLFSSPFLTSVLMASRSTSIDFFPHIHNILFTLTRQLDVVWFWNFPHPCGQTKFHVILNQIKLSWCFDLQFQCIIKVSNYFVVSVDWMRYLFL